MPEIIKITSPSNVKSNMQNVSKQIAPDALFDLLNPVPTVKQQPKVTSGQNGTAQQSLLQELNRTIIEPLLTPTGALSGKLRELLLLSQLFEVSWGKITSSFADRLFIDPGELLSTLKSQDQDRTIFRGEIFDSFRILASVKGQPQLSDAIANILKFFDCFVNQNASLKAIAAQGENIAKQIPQKAAGNITALNNELMMLTKAAESEKKSMLPGATATSQKELQSFLKNEYLPQFSLLVKQYPASEWIRNSVMDLVHYIVRYDKADMANLEEAATRLGEILKPLTSINEQGIQELKSLLIQTAVAAQESEKTESGMADLLSKALEKGSPEKISRVAHSLLNYIVQNESPVLPFVYFMIPIKFMDENVYGEFLIDKECKNRRGQAKEATNIFFTIQSDEFGNFEVDLLAKDKSIDLDIKCPPTLTDVINENKSGLRGIIEEKGYRLSNYKVSVFKEGYTLLERFPELSSRKVGIDVKI